MSDGMASNGLKFTKFLENWSGGSRVGVRDSTRTGMHTRARTHTHTHAHTHTHTSSPEPDQYSSHLHILFGTIL